MHTKTDLAPGVYPDTPEEVYFRWPAVSKSRLEPLMKSPLHCKWAQDHPSEPTPAMTIGSAVDCLVFEPEEFNGRFAVAEQCQALTQKKERCSKRGLKRFYDNSESNKYSWRCNSHFYPPQFKPSKIDVLTDDQSSAAYAIAKAVHDHPTASTLIHGCDEVQLSLVWRENNLLCKGRLDGFSTELKTVIDLKTCTDASPDAFARQVWNLGYHRQAAMYLRGCSANGIEARHFVIIAVETEPPYAVAVYTLTERTLGPFMSPAEYGNHQLLRLLDLYERCQATGKWEGYPIAPQALALPAWAMGKVERE